MVSEQTREQRPSRSFIWQFGGLVLLAFVVGLVSNAWNPRGVSLGETSSKMTDSVSEPISAADDSPPSRAKKEYVHEGPVSADGFPLVTGDQVSQLVDQFAALPVDARPDWAFQDGHLEGAVNLPFSFPTTDLQRAFAKTYARDRYLVLYCGDPACDRSKYLAAKLRDEFGFTRLFVYEGGYEDYLARSK